MIIMPSHNSTHTFYVKNAIIRKLISGFGVEYLAGLIIDNERLLMSSFGGMVLYILLSKEPIIQRLLSGSAGFIAAVMFSEPAANLLTDGQGKEYRAAVSRCWKSVCYSL